MKILRKKGGSTARRLHLLDIMLVIILWIWVLTFELFSLPQTIKSAGGVFSIRVGEKYLLFGHDSNTVTKNTKSIKGILLYLVHLVEDLHGELRWW